MSPQIDLETARVVVLSACETGLFDYSRYPDEFVGLNSGLLMAGTPAVVSTLWAVDDRSTALLMSEFYTRLLAGDSFSSAVNHAQLWLCGLTFSGTDDLGARAPVDLCGRSRKAPRTRADLRSLHRVGGPTHRHATGRSQGTSIRASVLLGGFHDVGRSGPLTPAAQSNGAATQPRPVVGDD